ncbi:MAG: SdpI family protein [Clostridia bacterium]|nr:SdpI family protein [Clostridia bacterium]
MSLKNAKHLLGMLSLTALIIAAIGRNTIVSTFLTLICVFASLAILYPNLAKLSNVSEDNPKVRTLRSVTIFTFVFFGIIVLLAVLIGQLEKRGLLAEWFSKQSEEQINIISKAFMALVFAVPVLFFGNVAPQIPFNRYTGLRLPWTVRDEDTWIVAHRVLGYISLPVALLVFVNVPTDMPLDTYVKFWWLGAVLLWLGIPGLISGVFFYRKWSGKLR